MFDLESSLPSRLRTLCKSFYTKAFHNLPIELCKAKGHALCALAFKVNELLSFFTLFPLSPTILLDLQFIAFALRCEVFAGAIPISSRELLVVARLASRETTVSRFRSYNPKLHFKCF